MSNSIEALRAQQAALAEQIAALETAERQATEKAARAAKRVAKKAANEAAATKVAELVEKATRVYYGGDKVCRCGCAGTYAEKGEKLFTSRLLKLAKLTDGEVVEREDGGTYLNVSLTNNKAFTVYFD
jgi:hypothetical protein